MGAYTADWVAIQRRQKVGHEVPRRKPITAIEPGLPLISLKLPKDNSFSSLVEVVVPKRSRDELILSTRNAEHSLA